MEVAMEVVIWVVRLSFFAFLVSVMEVITEGKLK